MCEIISVAVEPVTMEVFWSPGLEHHTAICEAHGLDYDKVFKPDIKLATKTIVFLDSPIALKRKLPLDMIQELMLPKGAKAELDLLFDWTDEHERSVQEWMAQHIPDYRKLIDFSDHSWNPFHYHGTTTKGDFHEVIPAMGQFAYSAFSETDKALLREGWRRDFERADRRVKVWQ